MRPAARWTWIFAAGIGVGYALVASGRVDRFFAGGARAGEARASTGAQASAGERPLPGPDWARVVAGAPSHAPRVLVDVEPLPAADPVEWMPDEIDVVPPAPAPATAQPPAVSRRRIEPGVTLSELLLSHYGRQGPKLAAAVARYNGLANPDAVRAGQELELPPLDVLAPLMPAR